MVFPKNCFHSFSKVTEVLFSNRKDRSKYLKINHVKITRYMVHITMYGTDLTQRRTPSRVLGYHSRATRTRSSICIIGLELAVVLALERKMVRAVLKI